MADELDAAYWRLIAKLEEEKENAEQCLGGDLLKHYRQLLDKEMQFLRKKL